MRVFRLLLALAAFAAAVSSPRAAQASGGCPALVSFGHPFYGCGYVGGVCPNCQYECSNGSIITYDTCSGEAEQ